MNGEFYISKDVFSDYKTREYFYFDLSIIITDSIFLFAYIFFVLCRFIKDDCKREECIYEENLYLCTCIGEACVYVMNFCRCLCECIDCCEECGKCCFIDVSKYKERIINLNRRIEDLEDENIFLRNRREKKRETELESKIKEDKLIEENNYLKKIIINFKMKIINYNIKIIN